MQSNVVAELRRPGATSAARRVPSVDIVRGAVIVLMALDHVRDFVTNVRFQPENLSRTNAALFATRWVTHFCAPTFFLLAGVGIGMLRARGLGPTALGRYLLTRGLWLLFLDLILTPVGWQFGLPPIPAFALVLWALGWSMIVMALLVQLPTSVVGVVSVAMIVGHNVLDPVRPASLGAYAPLWHFLHAPGFAIPDTLFIAYPLVPWVGVMGVGYVLADMYGWDPGRRRRVLVGIGASAVLAFLALRAVNGYGNAAPWSLQRTTALTVASFLNVQKYPPSLLFLLMTLGPALVALALAETARGHTARWLAVYGRVPMFFYVAHIFVAHAAAVLLAFVQSGEWRRIQVVTDAASLPAWYGVPLPGVYAFWVGVVCALYVPCRSFARLKSTRSDWWLRYL